MIIIKGGMTMFEFYINYQIFKMITSIVAIVFIIGFNIFLFVKRQKRENNRKKFIRNNFK